MHHDYVRDVHYSFGLHSYGWTVLHHAVRLGASRGELVSRLARLSDALVSFLRSCSGNFVPVPSTLAASLIGAPIADLLLEQRGLGMSSWRWLFIVEGIPAILLGIVTISYLTDKTSRANWLSKDERDWLIGELQADKVAKEKIDDFTVGQTLSDRRIWLFTFAWFWAKNGTAHQIQPVAESSCKGYRRLGGPPGL